MLEVTNKSMFRQRRGYGPPEPVTHVNINDLLSRLELEGIELSKLGLDVKGGCGERVRCSCQECLIHGAPVPLHRKKDCKYAAARSALVPEAERIAMEKLGDPKGNTGESSSRWTAEFNKAMERLSFNAGLLGYH
jgi:hypothetical protein